MPVYRGRIFLVFILMLVIIILGITTTDQVMKKTTLYAADNFFSIHNEKDIIVAEILGLHVDIDKKKIQDRAVNTYTHIKDIIKVLVDKL